MCQANFLPARAVAGPSGYADSPAFAQLVSRAGTRAGKPAAGIFNWTVVCASLHGSARTGRYTALQHERD
jgi:hypothetical protein